MYILLITYLLNGVQFDVPIEKHTAKSYCDAAVVKYSRGLHYIGAKVISSSCVWVENK